jgi:hypothetical protein
MLSLECLAPVSITVYDRLDHITKTIEALSENYLAKETVLYIFSDAAKLGDEEKIKKVRDYLKTINNFKETIIVEQKINNYEKNIKDAYTTPLNTFDKFIRMEDDIVTSPYFLTYMNNALKVYKDNKDVFVISGYVPNIDFDIKDKDIFLSKDFSAWGYATWSNRDFIYARERMDYYSQIKKQKNLAKAMSDLHPKIMFLLKNIEKGYANQGDFKLFANIWLNNMYTIKPKYSLVKNIGFDGKGKGKNVTNIFDTTLRSDFNPKLDLNLKYKDMYDKMIFRKYFDLSKYELLKLKLKLKIISFLKDYKLEWIKEWLKKYI